MIDIQILRELMPMTNVLNVLGYIWVMTEESVTTKIG